MGDRYEVGYRDKGNGWMFGILDGPEQSQFAVYGMSPTLQGTSLPGTPPIDPSYVGPVSQGQLYALGFGNVHVNFDTPTGYLQGFRDYLNTFADAALGTQVGPLAYVGNYGGMLEDDIDDDPMITFFRLTDDLNGNFIFGSAVIIDPVTGQITVLTDYGDLHTFNIAFDQVQVRSRTKMTGVEAMWTHELTNRHYMAQHQNNHVELSFGARFMEVDDFFGFLADGGILGRTFSDTRIRNDIVGPQVRAKWTNQRQRWRLTGQTSLMFGYNSQNWSQENGIGAELVPGATNRLLYAQPTYSKHGLTFGQFSPVGELRLESAYYLTQAFALKLGYTGTYVGNIKRASTSVRYYLPDMGYHNSGNQDLISNGVDFGVEFVY
jgi:Putative beta barrel porin-7 (BBP7)